MGTLDKLRRARVKKEDEFGEEESDDVSNFKDIRIAGKPEFTPENEALDDEGAVQRFYARNEKVPGRTRVEGLTLPTHLLPTGVPLDSGADAPPSDPNFGHGRVLKEGLGGYHAEIGTTEDSAESSTDSALEVDDATNFPVGGVMGVVVGGKVEARTIVAKSGSTLTPRVKFTDDPDDGAEVYNSHLFYLASDPGGSLQFILEGAHVDPSTDREDILWLLGMQLNGLGFELSPAGLAGMSLELIGRQWLHDEDVSTQLSGDEATIETATYEDTDVPQQVINTCLILATGSTPMDVRKIPFTELSITPNINRVEIPDPCAVNGVGGYQLNPDGPMATAEITAHFTADEMREFEQAHKDKTIYNLSLQVNDAAGKTAYLELSSCQVINWAPATAGEVLAGYTITLEALEDRDMPDLGNDIEASPLRIAVL